MAQQLINGILLGGVYALVGVGMTMIFGIVQLTNLAHGEFIILAAYLSSVISVGLGLSPLLTLIITVPLMFVIGYILQNVLINKLMERGSEPALLVTFGLSIIIQNALLLIFSADANRLIVSFQALSIPLGGMGRIPVLNLVVCLIGIATLFVLNLFLKKTYIGRSIRATSDDKVAAALMGVNVKQTYGIAMGLALATAAIAGTMVGMIYPFYPSTGSGYLIIAFGVVVIGGMGSITGTLVAGFIFGLAQVLGGSNYGLLIGYLVLIVMLAVRPQGLFAK
ncbi:MAG: branched-chain amino acid ABC transporter permease [Saccharofermentanales bacterium]|jgi:branched-chain amino acid transport system permease protein|nr:branched-chain amino acid ABC transporter permease [Clostridiaceae bacterium]